MKKMKKIKLNKNLVIFSIFVLFSTIIWLLNSLNQEYTTNLKMPVIYENMPKNKANISDLPDEIIVSVKADGYDILKYQLRNTFIAAKLDIGESKFIRLNESDTNKFFILTTEFSEQIEKHLSEQMKIQYLKPDTLHFNFTTFASKIVPIALDGNIIPKSQFILRGEIILNNDSVKISGPLSIIDTISEVKTKHFSLQNLSKDTSYTAEMPEIEHITLNPKNVKIYINIEEFSEKRLKIPINKTNVPDSFYLHLFPNSITIISIVGESEYEKVTATDFKASVDYYSIFEKEGSQLSVKIDDAPNNIYSYRFTPEFVEYIVEKK